MHRGGPFLGQTRCHRSLRASVLAASDQCLGRRRPAPASLLSLAGRAVQSFVCCPDPAAPGGWCWSPATQGEDVHLSQGHNWGGGPPCCHPRDTTQPVQLLCSCFRFKTNSHAGNGDFMLFFLLVSSGFEELYEGKEPTELLTTISIG